METFVQLKSEKFKKIIKEVVSLIGATHYRKFEVIHTFDPQAQTFLIEHNEKIISLTCSERCNSRKDTVNNSKVIRVNYSVSDPKILNTTCGKEGVLLRNSDVKFSNEDVSTFVNKRLIQEILSVL